MSSVELADPFQSPALIADLARCISPLPLFQTCVATDATVRVPPTAAAAATAVFS